MKAALYARVSTKDKAQDPECQLAKLREFCANRNFQIFNEYVDVSSGANWDRPALKQLMEDARHRYFGAVIITKLDRFGRSLIDLALSAESFKEWGINFICTDQPIDTTTPSGKLLFQMLGAIAEFERELIRDRVRDGMKRAKEKGSPLGRPKKKLNIKEVLSLYQELKSLRKTADKLSVSHILIYNLLKKEGYNFSDDRTHSNLTVQERNLKLTEGEK